MSIELVHSCTSKKVSKNHNENQHLENLHKLLIDSLRNNVLLVVKYCSNTKYQLIGMIGRLMSIKEPIHMMDGAFGGVTSFKHPS